MPKVKNTGLSQYQQENPHVLPHIPQHFMTEEDFASIAEQRVNNTSLHIQKEGGYILWLMGSGDNSKRKKYVYNKIAEIAPHLKNKIKFLEVKKHKPLMELKKKTKATYYVTKTAEDNINELISSYLYDTTCIVINDFAVLATLLHSTTGHGTKKTLSAFRGSVYTNSLFSGIPALVINDASKCYVPSYAQATGKYENNKAQDIQFFEYDLNKLKRIYDNPKTCYNHFDDNFEIVYGDYNVEDNKYYVSAHHNDFDKNVWDNSAKFKRWIDEQEILALDLETSLGFISCISVTGIDKDKNIKTYVVPHISPVAEKNQHMTAPCFILMLKWIVQNDKVKVWHNGNYDLHYMLKYNIPPLGINHDTMLMWHSMRAQMPKSLAAVSSIFNTDYYYWKDEIKGGADEKKSNTKYSIPTTRKGVLTYWRYAGLDTYHTLKNFLNIVPYLTKDNRFLYNYGKEYALSRGPILEMSYIGTRADKDRLKQLVNKDKYEAEKALLDLQIASDGIIETNTDAECIDWLYNTLLAPPPPKKAGRKSAYSIDQKQLKLVSEVHPIYDAAISLIGKQREHQKRVDMYSNHKLTRRNYDGSSSFHYNYSLTPYTGRLASSGSAFWDGTNAQNIPAVMRSFIVADAGKVLIDIDYSQADIYHFAVACGDKNMMNNIFDDRDTHSVHVEMILKMPYDEVMRLRKSDNKEDNDLINHPLTGRRQIIKKLSHGGNYGMTPPTAYLNASRESLNAAAKQLGIDTKNWTRKEYYELCDTLLIPYFEAYPRQHEWRTELVNECVENKGYMTCFGGLTCYFDEWRRPKEHQSLMRALLAFYGQGGTAGMINEAMLRLYYDNYFMRENQIELLLQTHDSLTFQVPIEVLLKNDIVNYILTMMELQCNFNGVDYVVPCEVNVGHRWSKAMPEVKRTDSASDITRKLLTNYKDENLI